MRKHAMFGFCLLLLLSLLPVGSVAAAQPDTRTDRAAIAAAQDYLSDYGYLDGDAAEPGVLDQSTRAALRHFQSFNNLEVTGQFDAATRDQMAKPRYDHHPDAVAGDYVLWPSKWNKTNLTYGFQNFTPDLTPAQTRAAIEQAFALWSAVTPLTFTEAPITSTTNPDIQILFASGNHGDGPVNAFDGPGGVLAHAYYPNQGPISGDAHFDDDENWSVSIPPVGGTFDLMTVAAHEFGHSLGLQHSDVVGALMFPFYGGPVTGLHPDDIAGIQAHYGSGSPPPPPPPAEPMYVNDVNLTSQAITNRTGGTTFRLTGQVTVHSDGAPVSGATVTATMTGSPSPLNAGTNTNGVATFSYTTTQPGSYTLTVTNVTKTGMTYDAGLNVETSASVDTDGGAPPPPPPPPPPGDDPMYVNAVTLSSQTVGGGRGGATSYQLTGQVTIHADGTPVSGATVTASLTGPGTNLTLNAATIASGVATFNRSVNQPGQYTLTVTNVTKSGMTYDSGLNVVSSAGVDTSGGSPPPPPPPPGDDPMYVDEVDLSYQTVTGRGDSTLYRLSGEVTILADGSPVSGATVTVNLTGPGGLDITLNAVTNAAGVAIYTRNTAQPGQYTLTVTNVTKSGMTYDSSLNVDDSDTVNVS